MVVTLVVREGVLTCKQKTVGEHVTKRDAYKKGEEGEKVWNSDCSIVFLNGDWKNTTETNPARE